MSKPASVEQLRLQLTDTYALRLNLSDCYSPVGYKVLSIHSEFSGAKDPDGLQRRFHVVLSNEHWKSVAALLDTSRKERDERA